MNDEINLDKEEREMGDDDWNALDDDEKQTIDEDRLLDEVRGQMEADPEGAIERAQDLGYSESDL
jgi:hypothetical protein